MHVITGLGTGGAEMMLYKLLSGWDRSQFDAHVVSLIPAGPMGERIASLGYPITTLDMRRSGLDVVRASRLLPAIQRVKPDLIQTWMYHADLLGGLAGRAYGLPVAWNLRQSHLGSQLLGRSTYLITRLCALLSQSVPAKIVCGSEAARVAHAEIGYDVSKMVVIQNGFDLTAFRRDLALRAKVRSEWGVADDNVVFGIVGRFHPMKDYRTFARTAGRLRQKYPHVRFVLCGRNVDRRNSALVGWLREERVLDVSTLVGERSDMPTVYSGLDVMVSTSLAEGFPNVVGEAMACGLPCVVTDVGDSALIVGSHGRIVPPGNVTALVSACSQLIDGGTEKLIELGRLAAQRVEKEFHLGGIVAQYQDLYMSMTRV